MAQGLAKAAQLLAGQYQWVITNVPYLKRGKQSNTLRDFCEKHYPAAKNDLATVFLDRCLQLCVERGNVSLVLPQNWLFLSSYKKFREKLLQNDTWHLIARLGAGAFETISGEVVKAILLILSRGHSDSGFQPLLQAIRVRKSLLPWSVSTSQPPRTAAEKAAQLITAKMKSAEQAKQLENPDARVTLDDVISLALLEVYSTNYAGLLTGDNPRFRVYFWEIGEFGDKWEPEQSTVNSTSSLVAGMELFYGSAAVGSCGSSDGRM